MARADRAWRTASTSIRAANRKVIRTSSRCSIATKRTAAPARANKTTCPSTSSTAPSISSWTKTSSQMKAEKKTTAKWLEHPITSRIWMLRASIRSIQATLAINQERRRSREIAPRICHRRKAAIIVRLIRRHWRVSWLSSPWLAVRTLRVSTICTRDPRHKLMGNAIRAIATREPNKFQIASRTMEASIRLITLRASPPLVSSLPPSPACLSSSKQTCSRATCRDTRPLSSSSRRARSFRNNNCWTRR